MSGFTKLFQSIVTSSIWSEDDKTRIVWVTMLALADRGGLVEAALPGLANAARVSLEDCEGAVNKFLAPDKYSRTEEWEGRRIEKVDGGWRLLNHASYRRKLSADDRLDYQRVKQAEYRSKKPHKQKQDETLTIRHGPSPGEPPQHRIGGNGERI
jgi:hypothetical protein